MTSTTLALHGARPLALALGFAVAIASAKRVRGKPSLPASAVRAAVQRPTANSTTRLRRRG